VGAREPSRESDHGTPRHRAAPLGGPEFKRTIEHDQQFLVGVMHVVGDGLTAGIKLKQRAPEIPRADGSPQSRPTRRAQLPLPRIRIEHIQIVRHPSMIPDPVAVNQRYAPFAPPRFPDASAAYSSMAN
jgi:hypothetical protein